MFFFVPETFWDRTPRPYSKSRNLASISNPFRHSAPRKDYARSVASDGPSKLRIPVAGSKEPQATSIAETERHKNTPNVEFVDYADPKLKDVTRNGQATLENGLQNIDGVSTLMVSSIDAFGNNTSNQVIDHASERKVQGPPIESTLENSTELSKSNFNTQTYNHEPRNDQPNTSRPIPIRSESARTVPESLNEKSSLGVQRYTNYLRTQPPKTFKQTLRPWNGKLRHENWLLVCLRPFILFAYPAILWSTLVYSLSIGWLIVLSESISSVYRDKEGYNFSPLGTGLVYVSPFIGGILGTVVAGKVSDVIVRFMSRRNDGVYEPEFRLVMAVPVALSTCIGLMGFGWSAAEKDKWIVPTVFFGVISFGCALGSTTAITFAVDSYRQYAGEALVTLNFSKSKLSTAFFIFAFPTFSPLFGMD